MSKQTIRYGKPVLFSLLLHGSLLILLILNFQNFQKIKPISSEKPQPVKIIKAVALDEKAVAKEMKRLEASEKKQISARIAEQNKLAKEKKVYLRSF